MLPVAMVRPMYMGRISARMPTASSRSKLLAPITSPMARPECPRSVEVSPTTKSGIEEPNATMVRPITVGDTLKRRAIDSAPLVT